MSNVIWYGLYLQLENRVDVVLRIVDEMSRLRYRIVEGVVQIAMSDALKQ